MAEYGSTRRRVVHTTTEKLISRTAKADDDDVETTETVITSSSVCGSDGADDRFDGGRAGVTRRALSGYSRGGLGEQREEYSYRRYQSPYATTGPQHSRWALGWRVNATNLAVFRIIFGAYMAWDVLMTVQKGDIDQNFGASFPELNFKYFLARRVPKPDPAIVLYMFWGVATSAILISIGLFYRLACFLFLVLFTYLNLLEKSRHSNNYYLYTLVAILMCVTDCNAVLSLDSYFASGSNRKEKEKHIPKWQLKVFQFQIVICYFFAGVAKINYDSVVRGEPVRSRLIKDANAHYIYSLIFPSEIVDDAIGHSFSLSCMMFNLSVGFLLLNSRTRLAGILLTMFVFVANRVFLIGHYPCPVMMAANILFLEPEALTDFIKSLTYKWKGYQHVYVSTTYVSYAPVSKLVKLFLILYCLLQVTVPLRHLVYPGDVSWTNEGHQFSWRRVVNEEDMLMNVVLKPKDGSSGLRYDPYQLRLTDRQVKMMLTDAELILQLVDHIKQRPGKDTNLKPGTFGVHIDMWRSLNGRPFQRWIDPETDLTKVDPDAFHATWLLPKHSDHELDFPELREYVETVAKKGFNTAFFIANPGEFFEAYLNREDCSVYIATVSGKIDVLLTATAGKVNLELEKETRTLEPGSKITLPSSGPHRVSAKGKSPAIWAYTYKCSVGAFERALGMFSYAGWLDMKK
ncbi:vitamin K-dependent gamma-carboxylase [Lingula anatina]|uniref:Vitamin K-dependent gamma-carboxylase n=1 Tax=Lingula anatina TaxID=7574 RepID=A0A1S3JV01_LINAN|nr:vitamin K-dependent gamma-carboxylase [Lingula anatina]|eukprot:XP_013414205.1 vitamin K-dependent gamma-carboxylase [Lingula anatina]